MNTTLYSFNKSTIVVLVSGALSWCGKSSDLYYSVAKVNWKSFSKQEVFKIRVSCNFLVGKLTNKNWESDVIFLKRTNCLVSMGTTNEVWSYGNNPNRSEVGMSWHYIPRMLLCLIVVGNGIFFKGEKIPLLYRIEHRDLVLR